MKTNTREDDSLPYRISHDPKGRTIYIDKGHRVHLSPREAIRVQQLEGLVESYSSLVREYFLIRSSLSANRAERKAWQILYLLQRFVEAFGRFPNLRRDGTQNSELTEFLRTHLESNKSPLLAQIPLQEQGHIETLLGISSKIEIPPFRHLDISRLRDAGDQIRITLKRTLSILGLEPTREGLRERPTEGDKYE